jgi:predicted cupin superfamily sugar epimerase
MTGFGVRERRLPTDEAPVGSGFLGKGAMTADEVKTVLGLEAHPREGGWFRRTYEAAARVEGGERLAGTAIYYLLEPGTFSEMHRLKSDEIFHFYAGDAVEQLQLFADGRGELVRLGSELASGARPQVVVKAGVWQGARLVAEATIGWALLGCTVTPGFAYEDYESATAEELCAGWPEWAAAIRALTRE